MADGVPHQRHAHDPALSGAVLCKRRQPHHPVLGGNASAFGANRGAGTWPKALAGVEAMLSFRGERGWPRIGIHQLDLEVRHADFDPRFVELMETVDEYKVVTPITADGTRTSLPPHPRPQGPCFWLGHAVAIDHEGGAHTCILETNTLLGSLIDTPLTEIISRASTLRGQVERAGRGTVDGCAKCSMLEGDAYVPS